MREAGLELLPVPQWPERARAVFASEAALLRSRGVTKEQSLALAERFVRERWPRVEILFHEQARVRDHEEAGAQAVRAEERRAAFRRIREQKRKRRLGELDYGDVVSP